LYQESAALDDKKKPRARQITLSSASQSDCEEEEEPKNNEPENEIAPQSVARRCAKVAIRMRPWTIRSYLLVE
jgi:hypothetical protein